MSKLNEIINGWGNALKGTFNLLPESTKKMAEKRIIICNVCPVRFHLICNPMASGRNVKTGEIVRGCGCVLSAKILSTDENTKCPLGKW
jgi:hypothetical protein